MSYTLRSRFSGYGTLVNPLDESDDPERVPLEDGELVVDDEETARAFANTYDALELVEDSSDDGASDEDDENKEDSTETTDGDVDEAFQPEAFLDRTPMDDVVQDIEDGMVDDQLDQVEEHAEREGVQDAVDARRDELSESE